MRHMYCHKLGFVFIYEHMQEPISLTSFTFQTNATTIDCGYLTPYDVHMADESLRIRHELIVCRQSFNLFT